MKRNGTEVEYKGYTLVKKHKTTWNIKFNNKVVGFGCNLKQAKNWIDNREK